MLSLYRTALGLRSTSPAFSGEALEWLPAPDGCLAFRRPGGLVWLLNLSSRAVPLPEGRLLLASEEVGDGVLAPDAAGGLRPTARAPVADSFGTVPRTRRPSAACAGPGSRT